MATPQVGIFLSDPQASSQPSGSTGGEKDGDFFNRAAIFAGDFDQAMQQFADAADGTASPGTSGMAADAAQLQNLNFGVGGEIPKGLMQELGLTLKEFFAELGDIDSLSDQELDQAFQQLSLDISSLGANYGIQLNPQSVQSLLSGGYSQMMSPSGDMPAHVFNVLSGRDSQGRMTNVMAPGSEGQLSGLTNDSRLENLQLLKQSVESQQLSSSSVLDGLKSMISSSAATSMAVSLEDVSNGAAQATYQLYNPSQASSVEEAEVSLQKIPVPPGNRQFPQELGERIMVMSSKSIQTAEIQLTPPELGSLMVKINVEGDQTSIVFSSPNAGVREALEQQSFRLKDMLEEQGMDTVDVDVSDQQKDDSEAQEMYADSQQNKNGGDDAEVDDFLNNLDQQKEATSSMRLVDYYA
jgi:hypothetical protein